MISKYIKLLLLKSKLKKKKNSKREKGEIAEEFAATYLELKGYRILKRNLFFKGGEIDILAMKGKTLYVFEVKMREGDNFGDVFESIDSRKRKRLYSFANRVNLGSYENIEISLFYISIDKKENLSYGIIKI